MAFGDPFAANVERKMTKGELIQAIRADISGELDAIYGYDAIICQNNFRHSFSLTWSGKTCDIRRSL